MFQAEARAVLKATGEASVAIGAIDMGQGAWTALAQIAAEELGLPIDAIDFRIGSSDLPNGGIAGGSAHTATAGTAIKGAATDAIAQLAALATQDSRSPLYGAGNAGVIARDGRLVRRDDESRSEAFTDILAGRAATRSRARARPGPTRRGSITPCTPTARSSPR